MNQIWEKTSGAIFLVFLRVILEPPGKGRRGSMEMLHWKNLMAVKMKLEQT
jgi:hypothetical protein